jgi:mxaJ protein
VHALERRGIFGNLTGYSILGDYRDPAPQRAIVDAVARGDVDVALVWGPVAGYFGARAAAPLRWQPVAPWLDGPQWPMVFDISMGVRRQDRALRRALDRVLADRREEVATLLRQFAFPPCSIGPAGCGTPATAAQRVASTPSNPSRKSGGSTGSP